MRAEDGEAGGGGEEDTTKSKEGSECWDKGKAEEEHQNSAFDGPRDGAETDNLKDVGSTSNNGESW